MPQEQSQKDCRTLKIADIENRLTRGKGVLYYNGQRKYFTAKIDGRIVNQWSLRHMIDVLRKLLGKTVSVVTPVTDKQGRITNVTIIFADDRHTFNKKD
jgi:hypothetical protein